MNNGKDALFPCGFLDYPRDGDVSLHRIEIAGWALPPDKIDYIEAVVDDTIVTRVPKGTENRPDLANAFPAIPGAEMGGFRCLVSIGDTEGVHRLEVRAVMHDGIKISIGQRSIICSRSVLSQNPTLYHMGLITYCNLLCKMCFAHPFDVKKVRIDESLLEACYTGLREYSASIKHIGLTDFGEPLLYKEIFDVIERVHEICPGASIVITTNGTLLTPEVIRKVLDSSLSDICISIDAGSRETYEKTRIGANFDQLVENIRALVKMRNDCGQSTPRISTNFILMKSNIRELPEYVRLCMDLGVDQIGTGNLMGLFDSDRDEAIYCINANESKAEIKDYQRIFSEVQAIALAASKPLHLPALVQGEPRLNCTVAGRKRPFIISSGDVYPCCILAAIGGRNDPRSRPIGNIMKDSLKTIWESEQYRQFREAFYKGELPHPLCATCPRYYGI